MNNSSELMYRFVKAEEEMKKIKKEIDLIKSESEKNGVEKHSKASLPNDFFEQGILACDKDYISYILTRNDGCNVLKIYCQGTAISADGFNCINSDDAKLEIQLSNIDPQNLLAFSSKLAEHAQSLINLKNTLIEKPQVHCELPIKSLAQKNEPCKKVKLMNPSPKEESFTKEYFGTKTNSEKKYTLEEISSFPLGPIPEMDVISKESDSIKICRVSDAGSQKQIIVKHLFPTNS